MYSRNDMTMAWFPWSFLRMDEWLEFNAILSMQVAAISCLKEL